MSEAARIACWKSRTVNASKSTWMVTTPFGVRSLSGCGAIAGGECICEGVQEG